MPHLRAFGHYLPARIVTNADLEQRTGRAAASIEKASGILERRYAAENENVADLGLAAANACLKAASLTPQDIGLILFSSGSAERAFPGPASQLAARLGLTATPAIDIPVASAGSLIALAFAADLAPRYGNILVVASEIMSRRISDADPRHRYPLRRRRGSLHRRQRTGPEQSPHRRRLPLHRRQLRRSA